MKKSLRLFWLSLSIIFGIAIFNACEIGLGESVDTEAPVLEIVTPKVDAIVRSNFSVGGSFSDDGKIAEVVVSFKRTDINKTFGPYQSSVITESEGKGTWSCDIDPVNFGITDGTYEITVAIKDEGGHTTKQARQFTVDNTPPVIVLSSPSSKVISNPTSYGSVLNVSGKAADDSDVDSMDFILYGEDGNEVGRKTINSVSTQIDIDLTAWGEELYSKVYGSNKEAGTKKYYLGLEAFDGARKIPEEAGDRGNSTKLFYLNNDFETLEGFKTSIAYNLLNGKQEQSDKYANWKIALENNKMEKAAISLNPVNNPYFDVQGYEPLGTTVDFESENNTYTFMNKNKLTVSLYVGRDKKSIKPETIGIYLKACDKNGNIIEAGNSGAKTVTLIAPYKDRDGNLTGAPDRTSEITAVGSTSYRWESKQLDANEINGLDIGSNYIVDVVAYDYNNIGIRNESKYGFRITTTSSAPVISIDKLNGEKTGSSLSIGNSAAFYIAGHITAASDINKLEVKVGETVIPGLSFTDITDDSDSNINTIFIKNPDGTTEQDNGVLVKEFINAATPKTSWIKKNTDKSTTQQPYYNFCFEVPKDTNKDSTFNINIVVKDTMGQQAKKEIEVNNDVEAPVFGEFTVTPYVDVGTVQKVNGKVTIKQLVSDNNSIKETWYSLDEGTSWTSCGKTTSMTFDVDTTKFTDKSDKTIWLKAEDAAGNIKTLSSDNATTSEKALVLHVDQSTDTPKVTFSNTNTEIATDANDLTEISLFGTSSNNYILGTITDDDGIGSVEVEYSTNGTDWTPITPENYSSVTSNKPTTFNLKVKVPSTEGKYQIKITVNDKYVGDDSYPSTGKATNKIGPFLIAVDDGAPELVIKTASGEDQYKASSFVINGTCSDANAIIKAYSEQACTTEVDSSTIKIEKDGADWKKWKATIAAGTEPITKTYYFQASDEFGQKTTKSYTFSVDPVAPKFKITDLQGNSTSEYDYTKPETGYASISEYGSKSVYFTVKGQVKDEKKDSETPSGVNGRYFYYYVASESSTKPPVTDEHYTPAVITNGEFITQDGWNTCTIKQSNVGAVDVYTWEAPISFASFANNDDLTVYFAVMDNAGNYSTIADNPSNFLKIKIDEEPPTVGSSVMTLETESAAISVVARDGESGIDDTNISVLRNGAAFTPSTTVLKETGDFKADGTTWAEGDGDKYSKYTLKVKAADVVAGKNEFELVVKDKAGNAANSNSNSVTINNDAPVIENRITGLGNAKDDGEYAYVKDAFTSTATISKVDGTTNKLKSVTWKDYYESTDTEPKNALDDNGSIKIVTSKLASGDPIENKQVTRTVTAENIFGQKSEWTYKYRFDVTAPVIVSGHKVGGETDTTKWFKDTTLLLEGTYTEAQTGISKITYTLNGNTGSIYTTPGASGKETYSSALSGFVEGQQPNVLNLFAEDKAGNKSATTPYSIKVDTTAPKIVEGTAPDTADDTAKKDLWYRLEGNTEWKPYDAYILTDGETSIEITGTYLDQNTIDDTTKNYAQSGIKEIVLTSGSNTTNAKDYKKSGTTWASTTFANGPTTGRWYVKATKNDLIKGLTGTCSVRVKIVDNAGNKDETASFTFKVDTAAPTVTLNTPTVSNASAGLNGSISISGSVTDGLSSATGVDGSIESIEVWYSIADQETANATEPAANTAQTTNWYQLSTSGTDNDNFTCSSSSETFSVTHTFSSQTQQLKVNSGKLELSTEETTAVQYVWIKVIAKDAAGHSTTETRKVKVDRDTDRPVIRFITPNSLKDSDGNLMSTEKPIWLKNTGTIIGMISDDDSTSEKVVKELKYKKAGDAGWTTVNLGSSSSFSIDVDDGEQTVYFQIKDNSDGIYESGATKNLQEVKFTDGTNNINTNAVLSMKVDKTSPRINTSNITYAVFDSINGQYTTPSKKATDYSYGGTNNKVQITIPASDANYIKSVKAIVTKADGTKETPVSGTCNDVSYNDTAEHVWTITDIPLSNTKEQANIEIEVEDNAGLKTQEKVALLVDNTAPEVKFSAPNAAAISSDKVTAYGTVTEICKELKYAITTDSSDTHPELAGTTKVTSWNGYAIQDDASLRPLTLAEKNAIKTIDYTVKYEDIVGSSLSWYIYFNGETATDTQTNTAKLENWLDEDHIGITTKAALTAQNNAFDKVVDLYLWIYAKDEAGNESYTKHPLKVDPQGGRPSVTIDYPEAGTALGGTIRLSGSAEDNGTVQSVWVQIISGTHIKDEAAGSKTFGTGSHDANNEVTAFNLKATDVTYMVQAGTVNLISNDATPVAWVNTNTDAVASKYGIKANLSGSSWNLKINTNQEFKPNADANDVYIRVYALDNENKWSYATTKFFQIDSSRPVISDVMLKQYASTVTASQILAGSATPIAEKEYLAGDYLNGKNGNWYVTFTAEDDNQIGSLAFEDEQGNETPLTEGTHYKLSTLKTGKTNDKVTVAYPLNPNGSDVYSWNFKLKINDTNEPVNTSSQSIELFYDNLSPRLRRPGSNATLHSINPVIRQNNGFYTIKSQIDESSVYGTQSGLKAVAFYFLRRNAVDNNVYVMDPMQVRTGNVQVKNAKTITAAGTTDGVVYDSGLYWLKRTITRDTNSYNTFTYTSKSTNDEKSIHVGGLIQIGGVMYTINSVNGTTVIVDKNIPAVTTGYFALGMVVDTAVEKYSGTTADDGYYNTWDAGDGDRMYESMGGTSANRTWEAQIAAKNIPDGPVELHYVAFDNAGNYSIGIVGNKDWITYSSAANLYATEDVKEVKTKTPGTSGDYVDFVYAYAASEACYVKNNSPRISSVTVGCDYDGSGTIGDKTNETKTYYYNKVEGKEKAGGVTDELVVDSGTAAFMKLTDASSISMEIIGGNGNLYYSYNIDGATKNVSGANTTSFGTGNYDGEESNYLVNGEVTVSTAHTKTINLSLDDFNNYLGKGSGNGSANTAYIANNTIAKPLTTFEYTIWDSTDGEKVAGANALNTWSSQKAKVSVKLDVQVHDETNPKMVIDDFTTSHFEAATGHIDLSSNLPNTPFSGTTGQFDKDPKVSGKIKVTGYAYDNIRLESLWLKADGFTFTPTTPLTGGTNRTTSDGYVQVAKFANSSWTDTENATAGWKFTVSDSADDGAYQNDAGHKVMWTLELDTTKVSGVAAADRTISVYAKDVRGTDANTTSGLYSSNESVSATVGSEDSTWNKPNYRVDVVPYITGIKRGIDLETKRSKLGKYQVVIGESVAVTGFNLPTTEAISGTSRAGYFRVITANISKGANDIATAGNKITTGTKGVTSTTLTVPGNSGYVVAVTNNIVSLNNMNTGNAQTGVNSDDEWTDDVYLNAWKNDEFFYFSNDPISPAMDRIPAKKVDNGYSANVSTLYGGWATNGSKFYASYANTSGRGTSGNAPSPATGNSSTSAASQEFGDPATFYDVVIDSSGNRYNILLDCWQGSTTGWGRNFVINKNGYYNHNGCSGTAFDNSNSTALRHVIERMGAGGTAPDNANSSDGFDEIFNQFLNPRVAMYNGVAYASYYDRYAKCLKYAAIQPNENQNAPTLKFATEGIYTSSTYRSNDDNNNKSGNYKNGACIVAGYDTTVSGGSPTNLDVGRWSAVAVDTASLAPVIAYYDSTNKRLMIATGNGNGNKTITNHTTTEEARSYPLNSNSPVYTAAGQTKTEGNAWKRQEVTGSAALKLGQYVSMVVDSSNNLHIAAYGTAGGNKLYYIKGTRTEYGTYTFETTCVDPNGAGTWTDIQLEGGKPVISYYDPSNDSSEHAVKVAYLDGNVWDTMTAPLASSAVSDRITLALDVTDGASLDTATANNSKLAVGYVSSRFDCIYLRKE